MVRTPFSAPSPSTPTPSTPSSSTPTQVLPPARPAQPSGKPLARDPSERRTLIVGRGISVQGSVQDAERLVVEGTMEATMIHAAELAIAQGGMVKGEVEVEEAEIAGTFNGTLVTRGTLVVRATGRVLGTARCQRLQVEDGGQMSGQIEMISDQPKVDMARSVSDVAA